MVKCLRSAVRLPRFNPGAIIYQMRDLGENLASLCLSSLFCKTTVMIHTFLGASRITENNRHIKYLHIVDVR